MKYQALTLLLLLLSLPLVAQDQEGDLELGSESLTIQGTQATPTPTTEPEPTIAAQPEPAAESEPTSPEPIDPGEAFITANTAYEAGEYARSIVLYRALLDQGVVNGRIYYDLGHAHLRRGELGAAIAAYRRAQTLQPRDQDLLANLSFARQAAKDAIAPPEPEALVATLFFWHYGLSRTELALVLLVLNLLFWSALAVRLYRRGSEVLRWTVIILLLLLLATGGSLTIRYAFPTRIAVVVPQELDALTAPQDEAVVRFKLHAGTEVLVKDQREGWYRIALPDGQQGWVAATYVELVER